MRFPFVNRVDPTSPNLQSQQPHFRQSSCQYMSSALSRYLKAEKEFDNCYISLFLVPSIYSISSHQIKNVSPGHCCIVALITMYLYNILCVIYSDVILFNRASIHYKPCPHHREKPTSLCYILFIQCRLHASSFFEIYDSDVLKMSGLI
jgi:hypothetical protein